MGDYAPINGLLSTIDVEIKVMEDRCGRVERIGIMQRGEWLAR